VGKVLKQDIQRFHFYRGEGDEKAHLLKKKEALRPPWFVLNN